MFSEGDDVPMVLYLAKDARVITTDAIESFSHYLELTFHGTAKEFIGGIVLKRAAGNKSLDGLSRSDYIMKMGEDLVLHKEGSFPSEHTS